MDYPHQINNAVCFVVAVFLNSLLLCLIFNRSPAELKQYSRILVQMCLLDLLAATFAFLHGPVFLLSNGSVVLYGVGPLGQSDSHLFNLMVFLPWIWALAFEQSSLSMQFIYRYLIVCRWDLAYL